MAGNKVLVEVKRRLDWWRFSGNFGISHISVTSKTASFADHMLIVTSVYLSRPKIGVTTFKGSIQLPPDHQPGHHLQDPGEVGIGLLGTTREFIKRF